QMATVAGLCVVVAGCGTARLGAAPLAKTRSTFTGPTVAGNRAAARAEATRLLSLARIPAGATRLAQPPGSLAGPGLGIPGAKSVVDQVMTWRVRLPFAAVNAWLLAHPPRGLRTNGSSSSRDGRTGLTSIANSYGGPASQAWQSANLEIST